jgi:hypothetical protein
VKRVAYFEQRIRLGAAELDVERLLDRSGLTLRYGVGVGRTGTGASRIRERTSHEALTAREVFTARSSCTGIPYLEKQT